MSQGNPVALPVFCRPGCKNGQVVKESDNMEGSVGASQSSAEKGFV